MSAELTIAADLPSKHMTGDTDHVDNVDEKTPPERTVGVSKFAHLTTHQAIFKFRRIFFMGLLASFGGMYNGYCISQIGNIVANQGFIDKFATIIHPDGSKELESSIVSIWGGMNWASQIVFQALSPFVVDRLGRKAAMYALLTFMLLAIIIQIVSKDWKGIVIAKVFAGGACGLSGPAVVTYMSEIAVVPQFRGAFLGMFSMSFAIGQFTSSIGLQILNTTEPDKYLHAFYSEFVYFGLFGLAVLYLPESPPWLLLRGRHEKAKRMLGRLVGKVEDYDLDYEFAILQAEVEESQNITSKSSSTEWAALFKWHNLRRVIAATLPYTFQQVCGNPYIWGYTTYFFQLAGVADPFLGSTILNCINVGTIIGSFYFIDRIGRRPLILWGCAGMVLFNFVIGGLGFIPGESEAMGTALVAMCACWVFCYSFSLGPIGWIGLVEITSPALRGKSTALAVVIQSVFGIIFTYTTPYMLSDQHAGWGVKIGLFFGGISLLYWIPTYFLYPETKNRTYAELDELYERGVPARHFGNTKTTIETEGQGAEREA